MNTLNRFAHSCQKCGVIVIDGTDPKVDRHFEFPYWKVEEFSQDCKFFRWALKSSKIPPYITDTLVLTIPEDSKDLAYLGIQWKDANDQSVPEDDTNQQRLYIFSRSDDPAAPYIKSRPIAQSPSRSVDKGWCLESYKSCLDHKKCKTATESNRSNTVPTRLLYVRPNSQVRLCTVSQGEYPLYTALSYCWGSSQQQEDVKTTTANVEDRNGRIDIRQLPKSIRDAVKVTQRLELSYLWVDALCIVQDNPIERESEISKMASIYRGATVTISAASAEDSKEGFLGNRNLKNTYGNLFRFPYYNKRADNVVEGLVFLSEQPIADIYQENIDKRAWTMQEDMVSLRLLRFGSKQTTWRCLTYPRAYSIDGGGRPTLENKDHAFSVDDPYRNTEVQSNITIDF